MLCAKRMATIAWTVPLKMPSKSRLVFPPGWQKMHWTGSSKRYWWLLGCFYDTTNAPVVVVVVVVVVAAVAAATAATAAIIIGCPYK